jgi:hypothetical protein
MRPSLPRLNARVLSTFLIVGLPTLVVALVVVLGVGQSRLRASYTQHLTEVATQAAATADAYIFRRVVGVALLGRVPEVRAAAARVDEPLDPARVREIDRTWRRRASTPEFSALFDTPVSRFFADVTRQDSILREILLTDLQGRLIAASNVTDDYFQADEEWWIEAYGDGMTGRVSVGDVTWDPSASTYALDIAVSVPAPDAERLAGILKVAADIRELSVVVDGLSLGRTGNASLVRRDGSMVFNQPGATGTAQYFAADLLRERYNAAQHDDPSFRMAFSARGPDGNDRLVAIAPSQLGASYPHLSWLVAVSQDEAELFAPIREQAWLIVAVVALVAVAVLALALWFSIQLAASPLGQDLDLHLVEHARLPRMEPR